MVPLWSTLLLTNFYVGRISFCHTNINNFRLAQKSSSKLFSSAKHELEIYIFGGKAIERAGALESTEPEIWSEGLWKSLQYLHRHLLIMYLFEGVTRKNERQNLRGLPYFHFKKENIFFTTLQAESFLKSRKQPIFRDATSFHAKWRLRNVRRKSVLMTCHCPDLGSASKWFRHISHDQPEALLRYG